MENMTRAEHVEWCKRRALPYLESGDTASEYASMVSDLRKHPATEDHQAILIGMALMMGGQLDDVEAMRKFINGFN